MKYRLSIDYFKINIGKETYKISDKALSIDVFLLSQMARLMYHIQLWQTSKLKSILGFRIWNLISFRLIILLPLKVIDLF